MENKNVSIVDPEIISASTANVKITSASTEQKVVAVDYDGTCVFNNAYPEMGKSIPGAVETLRALKKSGCQIILWTNRMGVSIEAAVKWFKNNNIKLDGINDNYHPTSSMNFYYETVGMSRKIAADIFIDDRNLGCPVKLYGNGSGDKTVGVDWKKINELLINEGYIDNKRTI